MNLLYLKPKNKELGDFNNYEIISLIGRGKYSNVYKGINIKKNKFCAIKVYKDIKENEIYKEINILKWLKKEENIPNILDFFFDPFTCTFSVALDFYKENSYVDIKRNFDSNEIKKFMYECWKILKNIHKNNIIHCDLKPQNIIIDKLSNLPKIIDFSHSTLINNEKKKLNLGCIFYNAPEILIGYKNYNEKIDIWALGCIFIEILLNRRVLFNGKNKLEQLEFISDIFGTKGLYDLCKNCNIDYNILKEIKFKNKINFFEKQNEYFYKKIDENGIDLLKKLLEVNPNQRITAEIALKHNYFNNNL